MSTSVDVSYRCGAIRLVRPRISPIRSGDFGAAGRCEGLQKLRTGRLGLLLGGSAHRSGGDLQVELGGGEPFGFGAAGAVRETTGLRIYCQGDLAQPCSRPG